MENVFNGIPQNDEEVVTTQVETEKPAKAAEKSERLNDMKQAFRATMKEDPSFKTKLHSMSEHVELVCTYGWGEAGNIVVDPDSKATKKELAESGKKRALIGTSAIVGYCVRNNSGEAIRYKTEAWAPGEDGKFYPSAVEKVLAPGETADLTRQYMTMFCAQPEISFTLSNGKVIRGSGGAKANSDLRAELEAYYFTFNKGENKNVNADEVKVAVGDKGKDGKWTVKAEFVETFGFLNNPKEGKPGGKTTRGTSEKYSTQDLAAAYIQRLINNRAM